MSTSTAHKRDPDKTRQTLLQAAFDEIYRHGYQGASLDRILKNTGVTKGALYHHFRNKLELGYAVLEEVIRPMVINGWIQAMAETDDPLESILRTVSERAEEQADKAVYWGCPLNNLAQEMSPIDEGFRVRIETLLASWCRGLAAALRQGQAHGTVRDSVDPDAIAAFVVASIEGSIGLAKTTQSREVFQQSLDGLRVFVESLRPVPDTAPSTA